MRRTLKWHSIYGACVAIAVRDHIRAGKGAPDTEDMCQFIEDAEATADLAEEVDLATEE